jgi:hypothetical protein
MDGAAECVSVEVRIAHTALMKGLMEGTTWKTGNERRIILHGSYRDRVEAK